MISASVGKGDVVVTVRNRERSGVRLGSVGLPKWCLPLDLRCGEAFHALLEHENGAWLSCAIDLADTTNASAIGAFEIDTLEPVRR